MISTLHRNQASIAEVCRRYGVIKLEVFGSAADSGFDEERSDVDFLVEYEAGADLGPWLSRYFELQRELETIVERRVDLVMAGAPKNRYFLREVNRTRKTIYASEDAQTS